MDTETRNKGTATFDTSVEPIEVLLWVAEPEDFDGVAEPEWEPVADTEALLPLAVGVALAKTCLKVAAADGLSKVLDVIHTIYHWVIYHLSPMQPS